MMSFYNNVLNISENLKILYTGCPKNRNILGGDLGPKKEGKKLYKHKLGNKFVSEF